MDTKIAPCSNPEFVQNSSNSVPFPPLEETAELLDEVRIQNSVSGPNSDSGLEKDLESENASEKNENI